MQLGGRAGRGRGRGRCLRRAGATSSTRRFRRPVQRAAADASQRHHEEDGDDDRADEQVRRDHRLQQLLRVRHRQERSVASMPAQLKTEPVDGQGRRACATSRATTRSKTLIKPHQLEERVYRLRCVEAWSMVIPWVGFPLRDVIKRARAARQGDVRGVHDVLDPSEMPGAAVTRARLAYVEGLRMDEAMNPLAILAVGLYGKTLMNQNGAPIRLVVPWKYGFKSIKSIVRIRFVDKMPQRHGTIANPREYGFYSNVNPTVDHPRWTQATERRIASFFRRPDADVQRLRRSGRVDVRRNGPEEVLLTRARALAQGPRVFLAVLRARGAAAPRTLHRRLGVNPLRRSQLETGSWALRFLVATLAVTPLRRLTGWNASFSTAGCSACSPSSTRRPLRRPTGRSICFFAFDSCSATSPSVRSSPWGSSRSR